MPTVLEGGQVYWRRTKQLNLLARRFRRDFCSRTVGFDGTATEFYIEAGGSFMMTPRLLKTKPVRSTTAVPRDWKKNSLLRDRVVDPATESEGALQEFAEGLGSGVTKAVQGVAELGGMGIDSVFDTNTVRCCQSSWRRCPRSLSALTLLESRAPSVMLQDSCCAGSGGVAAVVSRVLSSVSWIKLSASRGRPSAAGPMPAKLTTAQKTSFERHSKLVPRSC